MSGKIEISRELADDLLNPCADFATHDRLRDLLDNQRLCGLHTGDSCKNCGGSGVLDSAPGSTLTVMRGPGGGLYLSGIEDLQEGDVFRREVRRDKP